MHLISRKLLLKYFCRRLYLRRKKVALLVVLERIERLVEKFALRVAHLTVLFAHDFCYL